MDLTFNSLLAPNAGGEENPGSNGSSLVEGLGEVVLPLLGS